MGLIGEFLKYRKTKKILSFLETEYGIDESMLKCLPEIVKGYKNGFSNGEYKGVEENNKEVYKDKYTPEDLIKMFADETEEFYPYGKSN